MGSLERPVVQECARRSSVLEPFVVFSDNAVTACGVKQTHTIEPGEQPDYELCSAEGENGLTAWSPSASVCRRLGRILGQHPRLWLHPGGSPVGDPWVLSVIATPD